MLRHFLLLAIVFTLDTCPTGGAQQPDAQAAPAPAPAPAPPRDDPSARKAEESCVDSWLKKKGLNEYGDPEGTMYMGGTPLFDEQTGKTIDRLDYIYQKNAEAKTACHASTK